MAIEDVYARCVAYARRVCPPDPALEPADLVHAAWVKVGARLDTTRPDDVQVAYLRLIIGQIATDYRRRLKWRALGGVVDERHPDPARFEGAALDRVLLAPLLAAARTDAALALLVLYGSGWAWGEIGAATGVPTNTAKTRAHRWRQANVRMGA